MSDRPPTNEVVALTVPAIGDVIANRYEVLEQIGEGGMGVVYRVRHIEMDLELALKVLHPELSKVDTIPERFNREARAIAALNDPRIIRVTDFGRTESGLPFMAMELLKGGSLFELMQKGLLPVKESVHIVDQILAGLEHAHERGVVHRDLKPENVIVADQVKILDFGIAQLTSASQKLTKPNVVFGSPRYMSPEQATGEPVDHRGDLYAVGVILFELLSGERPFIAETPADLLRKHIVVPPPPLRINHPRGAALQKVIHRAMAKNPEDRHPNATTFRTELRSVLQGHSPLALKVRPQALQPKVEAALLRGARTLGTSAQRLKVGLIGASIVAIFALFATFAFTDTAIELAEQALSEGKAQAALQIAQTALTEDAKNTQLLLIQGHALLQMKQFEDARASYGKALGLDSGLVQDSQLQDTVRNLIDTQSRQSQSMILLMLEHADASASDFIVELTKTARHPALRRAAYERLEAIEETGELDQFTFLSKELQKNSTDNCEIRRWYVKRLIRLEDPRCLPILKREQDRKHGPLGIPILSSASCMQDELDQGIQALSK